MQNRIKLKSLLFFLSWSLRQFQHILDFYALFMAVQACYTAIHSTLYTVLWWQFQIWLKLCLFCIISWDQKLAALIHHSKIILNWIFSKTYLWHILKNIIFQSTCWYEIFSAVSLKPKGPVKFYYKVSQTEKSFFKSLLNGRRGSHACSSR